MSQQAVQDGKDNQTTWGTKRLIIVIPLAFPVVEFLYRLILSLYLPTLCHFHLFVWGLVTKLVQDDVLVVSVRIGIPSKSGARICLVDSKILDRVFPDVRSWSDLLWCYPRLTPHDGWNGVHETDFESWTSLFCGVYCGTGDVRSVGPCYKCSS